jgi:hypothetical protein
VNREETNDGQKVLAEFEIDKKQQKTTKSQKKEADSPAT